MNNAHATNKDPSSQDMRLTGFFRERAVCRLSGSKAEFWGLLGEGQKAKLQPNTNLIQPNPA